MNAFESADRLFANASRFTVRREILTAPPALREVSRIVSQMFGALADQEDHRTLRLLRRQLATLRLTTTGALVSPSEPTLQLTSQASRIATGCSMFASDLIALAEKLHRVTEAALGIRETPKEQALRRLLTGFSGRVGIVYPSRPVPGWDDELLRQLQRYVPSATLTPIVSRKALLSSDLAALVSVWPLSRTGFADELMLSYRAPALHLLAYKHENSGVPEAAGVPMVGISSGGLRATSQIIGNVNAEADYDDYDDWPESFRVPSSSIKAAPEDREHLVSARYVRLVSGHLVALHEDRRVIEVSSLLDGVEAFSGAQLPRTVPRDLRASDLIVLRTSGSGEYLIDVANSLIARDGQTAVMDGSLSWKRALHDGLQAHGAAVIGAMLRDRCASFSSPDNYLWNWTTNDVIKPMKVETFYALLDILRELRLADVALIQDREHLWRTMKLLVRYHVAAGQDIRRALLAQLRDLIARRVVVTTALSLELPGVDAGELSVLRVESVAPIPTLVPYTEIGILQREGF